MERRPVFVFMKFINLKQQPIFFGKIEQAFKLLIEPKYGPQEKALEKIKIGSDRECEIFFVKDVPKGIIVYKSKLQDEFTLKDAFELKTALLFDRMNDRGFGKFLFLRANLIAKNMGAKYIFCTMSNENPNLLKHLQHEGWNVLKKEKSSDNLYDVYVLFKQLFSGLNMAC
jgi:hypothetical protein